MMFRLKVPFAVKKETYFAGRSDGAALRFGRRVICRSARDRSGTARGRRARNSQTIRKDASEGGGERLPAMKIIEILYAVLMESLRE